jgi:protein-disulfide isomerase
MKKEVVVFGLVAVASVAFVLMQSTGDKKPGDKGTVAAVTPGDSDIIPVGKSYSKGPATAPVTIVEFSDFQCPFCNRVNPTLKQVQETYGDKVRIVFKHNPLPFHQKAPLASEAALAAGEQGKFWEMHDKLFANMQKLDRPDLEQYATELGLDMAKFKAALDSKKFKAEVDADLALGTKVGARGTPNFFINGVQLTGARPFENFKTTIDEQLKAAEELTKAGTKPNEVYAALVKKNWKAPAAQPSKGAAEDDKTVYKVPTGDSPFKGEKDAQVTIVEFSDYQCPFCTRAEATIKQVLDTYPGKVKVVFKHNPLPFHQDAPVAHQAAIAAGAQGKFWEMHDKLFANQKALKRENLDTYAQELGLDVAKFKADLDAGTYKKTVDADLAVGSQFGVQGTPNFFVNGRKIVGAQPFDNFKKLIDEEIAKTDALLKAGTAKADLYAKVTENGKTKAEAPAPREAPADDKTVYKVPVEKDDAVKGPADALVTIVEFSEFQCPFCTRVLPTIKQIADTYGKDVRVVFKHNPLPFHADAPLAAEAALAAGAQGKFWEMHDKLFANQKALKRENIDAYAQEVGLNMSKFKADLDGGTYKKQVERDKALAASIGAGGTPNFYINGRNLVGAQPFESFKKVIDEELKKAQDLVAKGTARSAVYAELTKNGATSKVGGGARPAAEDDTKVYDVKVEPTDAVKGNPKAPITIVEFSEFQCPFCARVGPTLKQIEETYGNKVRIVFKHNPLPFHQDAPLAAQASLAAGEQGKFWQMHDALFANQKALKREDLEKYAQELGLNMTKFKAALDANKFQAQIAANQAQAKELAANGTPHFFINGRRLKGAQPFESFKKVIDEELAKKGVK